MEMPRGVVSFHSMQHACAVLMVLTIDRAVSFAVVGKRWWFVQRKAVALLSVSTV